MLTVEQVKALLDGAKGNDMISRRDTAIIRMLFDLGGRLGELAGLKLEDVDRERGEVHVIGKGPAAPHAGDVVQHRARAEPLPAQPCCGEARRTPRALAR